MIPPSRQNILDGLRSAKLSLALLYSDLRPQTGAGVYTPENTYPHTCEKHPRGSSCAQVLGKWLEKERAASKARELADEPAGGKAAASNSRAMVLGLGPGFALEGILLAPANEPSASPVSQPAEIAAL